MKTKILMLLLVGVLGLSLTACDSGSAQSVIEAEPAAEQTEAPVNDQAAPDEEEDFSMEVPEAVQNLSEEDNALLNGELKDGVYTNRYFGYKYSVPEGGVIVRDNDDATEFSEPLSFSEAYEEGWGCLSFSPSIEGIDGHIYFIISALAEDEVGLSEEELVKKNIEDIREINKLLDEEGGPELSTAMLAGEEHPVTFEVVETEDGEQTSMKFIIPKGEFYMEIFVNVMDAEPEDFLQYFDKV